MAQSNPNAASIDELERRTRILSRLLEVSLFLNANLAVKPILDFIMDAACEITDSEAASILLYDATKDELRFVAANTPGADIDSMRRIPVPMKGSIAGQIARENTSIVIHDAANDPRIFRSVDDTIGFQTRSLLGLPMHIKGTVIGVIESLNKRTGSWTEDDIAYLTILASHAAVAIQNARQAEALRKAYDELDKLDKLKSDFIAIASHELRTPLGVILGYASFLKEEAQGELGDHANMVLNSALNMRSLIEDMTNLRYVHTRQVELHREEVPLAVVIVTAQNDLQALAEAKGHEIETDRTHWDSVILADRAKLSMALTNILNNAIKFTPNKGHIRIWAEKRPRELWVNISDNGIGIPPEQLDRVFDEFYQVADHMTRKHNGMGLGLSIARGLIEAHGGRVWVESAGHNKGCVFRVALPFSE